MPVVWRFLLGQYFKVLCLCVVSFIAVLLTTRLEEVAHFASLGAEIRSLFLFTLHQIPYILPIAIPVSALISSLILVQRLSTSHELTALRACGLAIHQILAPILIAAAYLALLNFYIVSEVATHSHRTTGMLKSELKSINPLLLLTNKHLMQLKGFHFDTLGSSKVGESAEKIILAMPNKGNRLSLLIANRLQATPFSFSGKNISFITSLDKGQQQDVDSLLIENIGNSVSSIQDFSQLLQQKVWSISYDHLSLPFLMIKLQSEKDSTAIAKIYIEIVRRISTALATFTFTLMGLAFGMSIGRNHSNKSLFYVIGLATVYLIAFFTAKGLDKNLFASTLLYLLPHFFIIIASLRMIHRISRGIES